MGGIANRGPLTPIETAGVATGLGALAGAFPTVGTTNTSGLQTTSTAGTTNTSGTTDLTTLLNLLQSVMGSSSGTSNLTTTQGVTPTLSPETYEMMNQLIQKYTGMTAPSMTGYSAQQTGNINNAAALQSQAVNNIMASRGLSTSPVAATAQAGVEQNRLNQITGMQQQIPILQNQLDLANLAGAAGFFSTIPKGAETTGTQAGTTTGTNQQTTTGTQTGTQSGRSTGTSSSTGTSNVAQQGTVNTSQGGGIGGAAQGAAGALATALPYLLKLGQPTSGVPNIGGGIGQGGADEFGFSFSDEHLKKAIRLLPQDKAIDKIRELKGRIWTWKGGEKQDSGVIAQEVEKVLPDLVRTIQVGSEPIKAVNYAGIIPYLIGAVQNLDSRVSEAEGV